MLMASTSSASQHAQTQSNIDIDISDIIHEQATAEADPTIARHSPNPFLDTHPQDTLEDLFSKEELNILLTDELHQTKNSDSINLIIQMQSHCNHSKHHKENFTLQVYPNSLFVRSCEDLDFITDHSTTTNDMTMDILNEKMKITTKSSHPPTLIIVDRPNGK